MHIVVELIPVVASKNVHLIPDDTRRVRSARRRRSTWRTSTKSTRIFPSHGDRISKDDGKKRSTQSLRRVPHQELQLLFSLDGSFGIKVLNEVRVENVHLSSIGASKQRSGKTRATGFEDRAEEKGGKGGKRAGNTMCTSLSQSPVEERPPNSTSWAPMTTHVCE